MSDEGNTDRVLGLWCRLGCKALLRPVQEVNKDVNLITKSLCFQEYTNVQLLINIRAAHTRL